MRSCDVLVIGSGPAGMAAAAAAAEPGCHVIVVDENCAPGGQIWRGLSAHPARFQPLHRTFSRLSRQLDAANIDILSATRVVDAPAADVLRMESNAGRDDIQYARLILATGARERFLPFPGWTLPGVLGAGGLQALVKSGLPIAGKRVVLAGSGPLLLAVAAHLATHGARIAGVFEQAPLARLLAFGGGLITNPAKLLEGVRYRAAFARAPYQTSAWVVRAEGDAWLASVTVREGRSQRAIPCDYLACGFHLVPNLELPGLLGCAIENGYVRVDAVQQSSMPHVYCAGELTEIGGLHKALVEGQIAGLAATGRSTTHLHPQRERAARFARRLDAAFTVRKELRDLATPETIICRCEDVRRSALENLCSAREARLHTRCGMGPCQGRVCGSACSFLFGWRDQSVRPPLTPVRAETLAVPVDASEVGSRP